VVAVCHSHSARAPAQSCVPFSPDSFRRFVLTDEFLDLLLDADEAELLKQQSQESLEAQTRAVMDEAVLVIRVKEQTAQGFTGQDVLRASTPNDDDADADADLESPRSQDRRGIKAGKSVGGHSRSGAVQFVHPPAVLDGAPPALAPVSFFLDAPPLLEHPLGSSAAHRSPASGPRTFVFPAAHRSAASDTRTCAFPPAGSSAPSSLPGSKRASLDRPASCRDADTTPAPANEVEREIAPRPRRPPAIDTECEWTAATPVVLQVTAPNTSASTTPVTGTHPRASPQTKPSTARIASIRKSRRHGLVPSTELTPLTAPIQISRAAEEEIMVFEDI
jgi:hypothetical protein